MYDFDTKLAAAGEMLEKLAAERGLNVSDFTEEETMDLLSTIMGEGGGGDAAASPESVEAPVEGPKVASAPMATKVAYAEALAEVMKVAQANGFDLNQASAEELHQAVEQMQAVMSDPQYGVKQAALQEKIAEADALGRVMAHAYVDELGKIASAPDALAEKKAAFAKELRSKVAGEAHPQAEKKAAFEVAAQLRAAEILVSNGINPETGTKFASAQEQTEYGAQLILQQRGYLG